MSLHLVILVGIGGGIGSILRYFISITLMPFSPWFTVIINISGGFLIGLLYQYTLDLSYSDNVRAFCIIGVCGGFTTFSAFGLDFLHLFREGQIVLGLLYVILSVIGTILAVFAGIRLYQFLN